MSHKLRINHGAFIVVIHNIKKLQQSSKFFESFFSGRWQNKNLIIDFPQFDIKQKHVESILNFLQGHNVEFTRDYYLYWCMLDYFQADPDVLSKFQGILVERRKKNLINHAHLFLCDSNSIDSLSYSELLDVLAYTNLSDHQKIQQAISSVNDDLIDVYQIRDFITFQPRIRSSSKIKEALVDHCYRPNDLILPAIETFGERFEVFTEGLLVNMEWENVAMCGGSLSLLINGQLSLSYYPYSDVDLFVWGSDNDARQKTMKRVLASITKSLDKNNVFIFQNNDVVVILIRDKKRAIQIINSGQETLQEILWDFDMAISQVTYTGSTLMGTNDFVLALIHQESIVINPTIKMSRILKYLLRGYQIDLTNVKQITGSLASYSVNEFLELENFDEELSETTNKYLHVNDNDITERVIYLFKKIYGYGYQFIDKLRPSSGVKNWTTSYCLSDNHLDNVQVTKNSKAIYIKEIYLHQLSCNGVEKILTLQNVLILRYFISKDLTMYDSISECGYLLGVINAEQFRLIKNAYQIYYQHFQKLGERDKNMKEMSNHILEQIQAQEKSFRKYGVLKFKFITQNQDDMLIFGRWTYHGKQISCPKTLHRMLSERSDLHEKPFRRIADLNIVIRFCEQRYNMFQDYSTFSRKIMSVILKNKAYDFQKYIMDTNSSHDSDSDSN